MSVSLGDAVLIAIARDGSLSTVEGMGFTASQIAGALRQHLKDGLLVRSGSKFLLGPNVVLPNVKRGPRKILPPLAEHMVEKMDENAQYVIEHRTFTQIRDRVRPQR